MILEIIQAPLLGFRLLWFEVDAQVFGALTLKFGDPKPYTPDTKYPKTLNPKPSIQETRPWDLSLKMEHSEVFRF